MLIERDLDCAALYRAERQAFMAVLAELGDEEFRRLAPATPEWQVRDVLAHLVGIAADLNAGNFGLDDPDAWTAAQVETRRGCSIAELGEEWEREAPQFEAGLRIFGYEVGSHYVGDLLHHVTDVHHALGRPFAPNGTSLAAGLDFYLDSFHQALTDASVGQVLVSSDGRTYELGMGEVVASVTAEPFELFRALGGRRSASQIRTLGWSGDLDAVIAHVSRYPLPTTDIDL